jgi:hypothetical protein
MRRASDLVHDRLALVGLECELHIARVTAILVTAHEQFFFRACAFKREEGGQSSEGALGDI